MFFTRFNAATSDTRDKHVLTKSGDCANMLSPEQHTR